MELDQEACYRAVKGRDRRFDGMFYTAVRTTGIYCRPSCPAITPRRRNVSFYPTAAGAQGAGYRACRRCLPDATPGSPEWDIAADVASRAMRLVSDGVVERDGVEGLARSLGYSTRQLNRVVTQEYGAGPLALARSRRAQTARVLIETTDLSFTDIAFAAGFASVRQFNDTIQEVYAATPTGLREGSAARRSRGRPESIRAGTIRTRIAVREPFAADDLHFFLAIHAVRGIEAAGTGVVRALAPASPRPRGGPPRAGRQDRRGRCRCTFTLADARDLAPAMERTRRLLDADCDPVAVETELAEDPVLVGLVPPARAARARSPGRRRARHPDGARPAGQPRRGPHRRRSARRGARRALELEGDHEVTRLFPTAATMADVDPATLRMPRSRGRALTGLAARWTTARSGSTAAPTVPRPGPACWRCRGSGRGLPTTSTMRGLGDPDVFLPTDVGVRNAAARLGIDDVAGRSEAWRPWRSYALMRLWSVVLDEMKLKEGDIG